MGIAFLYAAVPLHIAYYALLMDQYVRFLAFHSEAHNRSLAVVDVYILCEIFVQSNLTQWKRAGLITLKSLDRNQELLFFIILFPEFLHGDVGFRA